MKKETKCVQSGYNPSNGESRVVPIAMSTTFKYDSAETVGDLFDLKASGFFYTRLANPTVAAVEAKISDLEGGVGAMMTSSGQAASMIAVTNIASAGDHIIAASALYGGTVNLFGVTLKKLGIDVSFVDINNFAELKKSFKRNTKAVFAETLANPSLCVTDISEVAKIAHENKVPLIIDNTFATPVLCRPIDFGADIVVHSTSKYLDGHAVALGGIIVDSGNFDWAASGKFDCMTQPDESYHGLSYTATFGKSAYITKARVQLMRDMGCAPSPMNAFLLNLGTETLHLRMPCHSSNALAVAKYLQSLPCVKSVKYPGLETDDDYARAQKYLGGSASGVVSFCLSNRDECVRFMNALKLVNIVVHVADARSGILHPASSTHRQLTDEQLVEAGISPGMMRLSVGIENCEDIIDDIRGALQAAKLI